jgi:hypothetical protein
VTLDLRGTGATRLETLLRFVCGASLGREVAFDLNYAVAIDREPFLRQFVSNENAMGLSVGRHRIELLWH